MKQFLGLAFAGVLAAIVAGCGGGGGGGGPITGGPITDGTQYAGVADVLGEGCDYAVGVITTRSGTASGARNLAYQTCESQATTQAAGAARDRCDAGATTECAAIAVGTNSSGRCSLSTRSAVSLSNAQSSALQSCRSGLGSSADCNLLVSGCASGAPSTRVWRPRSTPPPGGIPRSQVGSEFGTTSTTGRTNLNLMCSDDVYFTNSGNVVLPSVDVVALPSAAGTVTLEYDSYDIPDRFVVQVGNQIRIDTQYVGTSNSVAEVNAVLTAYGFTPTSQPRIISPGNGRMSFQKAAGVTSAVVRVYAPLTGTAWEVTLKFSGSSCPGTQTRRYGAIATSDLFQCGSRSAALVTGDSRSDVTTRAVQSCRNFSGDTTCAVGLEFGSAFSGNIECAALAYGTLTSGNRIACKYGGGRGSTESAAQSAALSDCRSGGYSCSLEPASGGGYISACAQ